MIDPFLVAAIDSGGSPLAFQYRPGLASASGMTATRADATTCATYVDANRIVQTVAANVLRDAHYINGVRTTLREGAATNSALGSSNFAITTYWDNAQLSPYTLAAATSCISGQAATKHTNTSQANNGRFQNIGTFVNGQVDCAWMIVEEGTCVTSRIDIRDNTAAATAGAAVLTWATLAVSSIASPTSYGAFPLGATGPNGGRLYVLWVTFTGTAAGTGANGNTRTVVLRPTGTAADTTYAYLHHAQLEAATSVPSSPIVTVAAAVIRAADLWSFPWSRNPEAGTWYVDAYDLNGTVAAGNRFVFHLTNNVSATAYAAIYKQAADGIWAGRAQMAAGSSISIAAAASTFGDRVEGRAFLTVTGANVTDTFGQSINAAAEAVAAAGTTRALDAAYAAPTRLYIGTAGDGTLPANLAIRSIAYIPLADYPLSGFRALTGG